MEIDWSNDESVVLARHPDAVMAHSFGRGMPGYQVIARSAANGHLTVRYSTRAMAWATARLATTVSEFERGNRPEEINQAGRIIDCGESGFRVLKKHGEVIAEAARMSVGERLQVTREQGRGLGNRLRRARLEKILFVKRERGEVYIVRRSAW